MKIDTRGLKIELGSQWVANSSKEKESPVTWEVRGITNEGVYIQNPDAVNPCVIVYVEITCFRLRYLPKSVWQKLAQNRR